MATLSVIMSIFNESEIQINESVKSILAQSFCDFEFIIIDDNPKRHDVQEIVSRFNDHRIILVKNDENIGLAMSMNKAAKCCNSDILVRMDADDIADTNRLAEEFSHIKTGNYDLVCSNYRLIDENSELIRECEVKPDLYGEQLSKIVSTRSFIHHPTVMMKKKVFDSVGGYRNFPCAQDFDLWLRLQESGCRFYYIGHPLLSYRINNNGTTLKRHFQQQLTKRYCMELSIQRMLTGKDDFSDNSYVSFLKSHGFGNHKRERNFEVCFGYLSIAQSSKGCKRLFYRLMAFILDSNIRAVFFNKYKKELLVSKSKNTKL